MYPIACTDDDIIRVSIKDSDAFSKQDECCYRMLYNGETAGGNYGFVISYANIPFIRKPDSKKLHGLQNVCTMCTICTICTEVHLVRLVHVFLSRYHFFILGGIQ